MDVFEGYCVNKGMVLASVARVRFDFGIPSLTPQRLRALGERLAASEDGYVEIEQVVLAAEKLPISLVAMAIPGIEVVGLLIGGYLNDDEIAALDTLLPSATTGMGGRAVKGEETFPVIGGLGDAFVRDIDEGEMVLADGNAGRVIVAPDAYVVSTFQSKTERKRYFLEGEHIAAKTASDNRIVAVYAYVEGMDDIASGMEAGADGVYMAPSNTVISESTMLTTSEQVTTMHEVMDLAGGKPIILDVPSTAVAFSALVQGAAAAPVSMAANDLAGAKELVDALEMTRNFSDPDAPLGDVTVLLAPPAPGDVDAVPEDLDGIGGILLRDPWRDYDIAYILPLLSLARRTQCPVTAALTANWRDELEDIIGFGVNALISPPADTADVKDAIREL